MTRKKFLILMIIWLAVSMAVIGFLNLFWETARPFYAEGDIILFSFGREAALDEPEGRELRAALADSRPVGCCTPQTDFGVQIGEYKFYPAADYCPCMEIYKGDKYIGGYEFYNDSSRTLIWNKLSEHFNASE